jgi:hypothetical protein
MFNQEKADAICARLAEGESLRAICRDDGMPSAPTVILWVRTNKPFAEQYATARETGYQLLADQLLEIADDSSRDTYVDDNGNTRTDTEVVARSRLRLDTRKWMLSKMLPKVYGDKVELGGSLELNAKIERITRRIVDGTDPRNA